RAGCGKREPRPWARRRRSSTRSIAISSRSIAESSPTRSSSSICNRDLLLLPIPDHDHPHHLVVLVGMRHGRAFDEQPVALETDEAGLLAADPGLVPGGFHLGDDLAVLDAVAAGIGDHGAQRLRAL